MKSGTSPPEAQSQWWLPREEPGPSLCGPPSGGRSDWGRGPCVLASGEQNGRAVVVGRGHLVVAWAWALAWALPLEHVEEGSQAVGPHRAEDHSQGARAAPVEE